LNIGYPNLSDSTVTVLLSTRIETVSRESVLNRTKDPTLAQIKELLRFYNSITVQQLVYKQVGYLDGPKTACLVSARHSADR